jgi:hypothetical protein
MEISISNHAREQMSLRGATEAEVIAVMERGSREPAMRAKFKASLTFDFNQASPVNGLFYHHKTVEAIWSEDFDETTVITVLVFYGEEYKP